MFKFLISNINFPIFLKIYLNIIKIYINCFNIKFKYNNKIKIK
jgi:hypothetical protein